MIVCLGELALASIVTFGMLMYSGMRERQHVVSGRALSGSDRTRTLIEYGHAGLIVLLVILLFLACIGVMMRRRWGARWLARWGYARLLLAGGYTVGAVVISTFGAADERGPADPSAAIASLLAYNLPILLVSVAFPLVVLLWLSKARIGEDIERWE